MVKRTGWCFYRHGNTDCSVYASPEMRKRMEMNRIEEKLLKIEKLEEAKKRKQ